MKTGFFAICLMALATVSDAADVRHLMEGEERFSAGCSRAKPCSVLAGPQEGAPAVGQIGYGNRLRVLAVGDYGWVRVRNLGQPFTGWLQAEHLGGGVPMLHGVDLLLADRQSLRDGFERAGVKRFLSDADYDYFEGSAGVPGAVELRVAYLPDGRFAEATYTVLVQYESHQQTLRKMLTARYGTPSQSWSDSVTVWEPPKRPPNRERFAVELLGGALGEQEIITIRYVVAERAAIIESQRKLVSSDTDRMKQLMERSAGAL